MIYELRNTRTQKSKTASTLKKSTLNALSNEITDLYGVNQYLANEVIRL